MAEYEPNEVDISFSLLLELMDALKGYGSVSSLVGGWAPYFLLKSFSRATEDSILVREGYPKGRVFLDSNLTTRCMGMRL